MAYIGKTPTVGNFVKLDALTASATASYTMQVDSVNFSPESVNHMLVSLNGVIQSPTTSYTISGSTITFASALTSSDSIDFIMVYGNVLDIGTPSDATVTNAKTNFVSTSSAAGLQIKGDGTTDGTLQLNCSQNSHGVKIKSPAHSASASYTLTLPTTDGSADEFLKTDGSGVLSWASAGGANTPTFLARKSGDQTGISSNTYTKVTGWSEIFDPQSTWDNSNSKWSPASAGKYFIFGTVYPVHVDSQRTFVAIYKNGAKLNESAVGSGDADSYPIQVSAMDDNDGDDYYEIYVSQRGTGTSVYSSGVRNQFGGFKIIT